MEKKKAKFSLREAFRHDLKKVRNEGFFGWLYVFFFFLFLGFTLIGELFEPYTVVFYILEKADARAMDVFLFGTSDDGLIVLKREKFIRWWIYAVFLHVVVGFGLGISRNFVKWDLYMTTVLYVYCMVCCVAHIIFYKYYVAWWLSQVAACFFLFCSESFRVNFNIGGLKRRVRFFLLKIKKCFR